MTYEEFLALLSDVVSEYSGDNLPGFTEKIDSVRDAGKFLNQEWVPKEQYDSLFNAFKTRYQEEFSVTPATKTEPGNSDVIENISEPKSEEPDTEPEEPEEEMLEDEEISYEDLI